MIDDTNAATGDGDDWFKDDAGFVFPLPPCRPRFLLLLVRIMAVAAKFGK